MGGGGSITGQIYTDIMRHLSFQTETSAEPTASQTDLHLLNLSPSRACVLQAQLKLKFPCFKPRTNGSLGLERQACAHEKSSGVEIGVFRCRASKG